MESTCQKDGVTTPCHEHAFSISGRALYLQISSIINQYPNDTYSSIGKSAFGVQNDWNWGFQLEANYRFANGNDFNLNWYRLHTNLSTNNAPGKYQILSPGALQTINVTQSQESMNPQFDQVNLEIGQRFNYGVLKYLRFHGGAQYSRVANQTNSIYAYTISQNGSTTPNNDNINVASSFNGFGPRVGLDIFYDSPWNFSPYAKFAVGMLAGTTKTNVSIISSNFGKSSSLSRVVPELDAKLGLTYNHVISQGLLSVDIGWLWMDYLNALGSISLGGYIPAPTSNFEVQGFYFGLKYSQ
jgi:hypothetical protein